MLCRGTPPCRAPASKYARAVRLVTSVPLYKLHPRKHEYARWLATELADLGCLFVKTGQWVSTRTDIFPRDVSAALNTLQRDVKPMRFETVEQTLRDEGVRDALVSLDPVPVSSGSVAQVHRGTLRDGRYVAVKVQRQGLDNSDYRLLLDLCWPLRFLNAKVYADFVATIDQVRKSLENEKDFVQEAKNMEIFQRLPGWTRVPTPYAELSTAKVLVMEFVESAQIRDAAMSSKLFMLFATQLLVLGHVHTDLHPGNIGVDDRGRIVLYDFGSVMKCPDDVLQCFKYLAVSFVNRNPARMVKYMLEFGVLRPTFSDAVCPASLLKLEAFVHHMLAYLEHMDIRKLSTGIKDLGVLSDVEFRDDVVMLFRTFTLLEGLCKEIDPAFAIARNALSLAPLMLLVPDILQIKVDDDIRSLLD